VLIIKDKWHDPHTYFICKRAASSHSLILEGNTVPGCPNPNYMTQESSDIVQNPNACQKSAAIPMHSETLTHDNCSHMVFNSPECKNPRHDIKRAVIPVDTQTLIHDKREQGVCVCVSIDAKTLISAEIEPP
jgi:hypothetical protein